MNQKDYFYLAGLPRTGSTVLGEILNQNDNIHVTPASPMSEIICEILAKWRANQVTLKAYKHPDQLPNVWRGVRDGMYKHRDESVVIDKSWAWHMKDPISAAREYLGEEMKVICTVDNITDCLASFIMLIRNNPEYNSFVDTALLHEHKPLTDENRCLTLMNPNIPTSVGWCYQNLKQTWQSKSRQNLLLIERKDLIDKPIEIIEQIYNFIDRKDLLIWGNNEKHHFNQIEKEITENDAGAYGIPNLHALSPALRDRSWDAKEVLGNRLYFKYKKMEFWRDKKRKL